MEGIGGFRPDYHQVVGRLTCRMVTERMDCRGARTQVRKSYRGSNGKTKERKRKASYKLDNRCNETLLGKLSPYN